MGQKVFQFKIVLQDIKPTIWRRIQISDICTFWKLHEAIQCAFGWTNSHLHCFEVLNPTSGKKEYIGIEEEELEHKDGSLIKVRDYISPDNDKMLYEYDFGDCWEHLITLEKIINKESGQKYPTCIDGARACLPEDVGGVGGYENFLEIIGDPLHPEYKSTLRWAGGKFRPEHFDPKKVRFKRLACEEEERFM